MGPRGATASPLDPYVPRLLRCWPLDVAWQALEGSLMSADISGFTALSERLADRGREGAEEINRLISGCFDDMIEACHQLGGDVVKFGGDAILVWFPGPNHAERVCRAASDVRRALRRPRSTSDGRAVRLGISIGVHAGEHHFFVVRIGDREELIVSGPGATATVDAESAAGRGEILMSSATAAVLGAPWTGEVRPDGVVLGRTQRIAAPVPDVAAPVRPVEEFVAAAQQAQILAGAVNEHRQVAMAFISFEGVDQLVRDGQADECARRLQALANEVGRACEEFGVFLLETDVYHDGGKLFMAAGAPLARGGDEERLLRAVRRIVDTDPGLGLRAGINRGWVYAGDLGSARRRTYTAMGDATNLAARLMAKAAPGQIVVSRPAMEWASSRFEYEPLEPFLVKGKSIPIYAGRLGRLLGRRDDLDRVDQALVGRDHERALLLAAADRAWGGRSETVVVRGGPGIGKTRLALEAIHHADIDHAFARCQPFDRLTAWSVTHPLLRAMLRIDPDADGEEAGEMLLTWLDAHRRELVPLAPLLAPTIGAVVPPTEAADAVRPEFRRDRTLLMLREVIEAAVEAPTTVLVDDVDHADDATRDLMELLARDPVEAPLLLVATGTPDDPLGFEPIDLGPLTIEDVREMVRDLLGDLAITPATVRAIVQRSEGNPLFAGELVRALAEDPNADVPDSLEAMVEARIDVLEPADRRLLRIASVLGSVVEIPLLAEMVDPDLIRRQDRWDRLDRFLERVGPGVVRFRFDTYHRVVYGGLSYRLRRQLHGRLIEVLEAKGADSSRDELALLAFHASRGSDRPRTWGYGTSGATAAADAAQFDESARLFSLALPAVPDGLDPSELRGVYERAGDVYEVVGDFGEAERVLALAHRHAPPGVPRARLLRKRAEVAERIGDLDRVRRLLRRAERELSDEPWSSTIRELARIESARSVLAIRQSRLREAWNFATAALAKAQLLQDWPTAAHAALMVDNLVTNLRWEGVEVERPDVAELYRLAGDPVGEAKYVSNRATDAYFDGDWATALRRYRRAAEQSAEHGHAVSEATCLNNIGEILSDQGRYDEAREMFRAAGRTWRAIGYSIGLALLDANLGRLATRVGAHVEAEQLLEAAMSGFESLGATSYVVEVRLRTIENAILAGAAVLPDWPTDDELDADVTLRLYADRLRAGLAIDETDRAARLAVAIGRARQAGLPFELALLLRTAAVTTDDRAAADEAAAIWARLGVVVPPPVARPVPTEA